MIGNIMDVTVVLLSLQIAALMDSLWDDDEDKSVLRKRLENAMIYQFRRQSAEFAFWYPVFGMEEFFKMTNTPIASSRYLMEVYEAVSLLFHTPFLTIGVSREEELKDKRLYYQTGTRKGQSKLAKQWYDVIPGLKVISRLRNFDTLKDFGVRSN